MHSHSDPQSLLRTVHPDAPVLVIRPHVATAAAARFVAGFEGTTFYAVKANPDPLVLQALWDGGVRAFDVASPAEFRAIATQFPGAPMAYMNPVKSRRAIDEAYREHGIRTFAVDTLDELDKIRAVIGHLRDTTVVVRLAVPDGDSAIPLSSKFGAGPTEGAALLRAARADAHRVGVSFHVGSQTMRPHAYTAAMGLVGQIIRNAGVVVDVVDVGGGFPEGYPHAAPPPLEDFLDAIHLAFERMPVPENCALWAEPGRVLCAAAGSVLARVELRKGRSLYLNDGTYGSLFDAGAPRWTYPTRRWRPGDAEGLTDLTPFDFYGPTCDGMDHMPGPFLLPEDTAEGDWIEIGMLGAYGATMRTAFNGFDTCEFAVLTDAPLTTTQTPAAYRAAVVHLEA